MRISARNQLPGTVRSVSAAGVMAEVVMTVGKHEITALITREAVQHLALKEGDSVVAIIKSTEVMIGKPDAAELR